MAQGGSQAGAPDATDAAQPLVSIVIPVFNQWAFTWKCLLSLASHTAGVSHEIIVVDDASSDETAEALALLDNVRVHRNPLNSGFARSCNQGARMARGKYLLFLNNDTEVQARWLPPLVDILEQRPDVAMVGSKLLFPDGSIQHGGVVFSYAGPLPVMPFHLDYRQPANVRDELLDLHAVTAACMLVRPQLFSQLGGFDEGYRNGYEDVDLCLKVKEAGHRILYTPRSVVTHHESQSDGRFHAGWANEERLALTWIGRFKEFEFDFRRLARPAPVDPERPGVTVVVVVRDTLVSVAPCLENLRHNIGPQDQLIVVDDGSRPATRKYVDHFLQSYPGLGTGLRLDQPLGFTAAVARALDGAPDRPYAAVLPANVKVTPGWLDRLLRHLRADAGADIPLGAISPQEGDPFALSAKDRLFPPDNPDPAAHQPPLSRAGAVPEALCPPSLCLVAPQALLAALAHQQPDVLFGPAPDALARALTAQGKRLGAAPDVQVYRLEETRIDARQRALRQDYLGQQARTAAERGDGPLSVVVIAEAADLGALQASLDAVVTHTPAPFQLVVVDDGGGPEIGQHLRSLQPPGVAITLVRNRHREGTAFARNQGLAAATGKQVALLDSFLLVSRGWSHRLQAALASDPALGAVGPVTNLGPGLQARPPGTLLGLSGTPLLDELPGFADQVALESRSELLYTERLAGSALLLSRALLDRIGGLDPCFVRLANAEQDHSDRARRAGLKLAVACDVYIHEQRARETFNARERRLADQQDRDLAAGRAADPELQRASLLVPLAHGQIFHPRAPALDLGLPRELTRLLLIPDMEGSSWRDVVRVFVRTFTAADRVALCLRIEPPSEARVREAWGKVSALLGELGLPPERCPEIVFEGSALAPARRGGLYTGASAFISCPGPRDHIWRREASAAGLTIIETNAEQLSRLLRAAA